MTSTDTTQLRPADVFLHLIATLLTPMFLAVTDGDPAYARMAAIETINAYGARTLADLLPIAQIIAFGFAVLDSLNRSMAETLSTTLVLRLRGNAANLDRAAERSRRALRDPPLGVAEPTRPEDARTDPGHREEAAILPDPARTEQRAAAPTPSAASQPEPPDHTALNAAVAASRHRIAELDVTLRAAGKLPPNRPAAGILPTSPLPAAEESKNRDIWATSMMQIAREVTTAAHNLPEPERREASMRAAALSSVAHDLLSGQPAPPFLSDPIPSRPHR